MILYFSSFSFLWILIFESLPQDVSGAKQVYLLNAEDIYFRENQIRAKGVS